MEVSPTAWKYLFTWKVEKNGKFLRNQGFGWNGRYEKSDRELLRKPEFHVFLGHGLRSVVSRQEQTVIARLRNNDWSVSLIQLLAEHQSLSFHNVASPR